MWWWRTIAVMTRTKSLLAREVCIDHLPFGYGSIIITSFTLYV